MAGVYFWQEIVEWPLRPTGLAMMQGEALKLCEILLKYRSQLPLLQHMY